MGECYPSADELADYWYKKACEFCGKPFDVYTRWRKAPRFCSRCQELHNKVMKDDTRDLTQGDDHA